MLVDAYSLKFIPLPILLQVHEFQPFEEFLLAFVSFIIFSAFYAIQLQIYDFYLEIEQIVAIIFSLVHSHSRSIHALDTCRYFCL